MKDNVESMGKESVFVPVDESDESHPRRPLVPLERGEHGVYTVRVNQSAHGRKVDDAMKPPNFENGVI